MRAALTALLFAALLVIAPAKAASPPGTPHLTVGADIKQLIFDWDDTAGAAYYRLLYRVGSGSYQPVIDNIPAATTQAKLSIAVHLQAWSSLRYAVAACNSSGCTNSPDVFPQNLMLDTIGYLKASNADSDDRFGWGQTLSDDGRTLAVTAALEASNATGVNGNQADNSSPESGAVYVFRRTSTGWRQEAYLKAGVNESSQFFGTGWFLAPGSLAINGNGSLLAVGASGQKVAGFENAGAVFVYQRSSSGSWSLVATLHSPAPLRFDLFGQSLDMSLDGRTLKVDAQGPFRPDGTWNVTHIYVRPGATWQHSATIVPAVPGDVCQNTRLSRDGNTLVASCENILGAHRHVETFKRSGNTWSNVSAMQFDFYPTDIGLALDGEANTMAIEEATIVEADVIGIYKWTGAAWVRKAGIPVFPYDSTRSGLTDPLALNRDGNLLAIGYSWATEEGAGVSPASHPGGPRVGAVYVWKRDDRSGTWVRRSVIKAPNPDVDDFFGVSLSMCGSGKTLAIGADAEDSKARGVDGDRTDDSRTDSGAVYLY
jgi:hypothetical protein